MKGRAYNKTLDPAHMVEVITENPKMSDERMLPTLEDHNVRQKARWDNRAPVGPIRRPKGLLSSIPE